MADRLMTGTPLRRRSHMIAAGLLLLLGALLVADVLTPPTIRFGPMMVAAPALAAVFCSPLDVLVVILVTLCCVALAARANLELNQTDFPVQLTTIILISAATLAASAVRRRREQALDRSRTVAEITQRLLLRPLPQTLGSLTLSSLYLAADEEALIGGDLYAASRADGRVRILVGDAQGKGLAALEMAGFVLGAFRRASRGRPPLVTLATSLDDDFRSDLRESAAAGSDSGRTRGGSYEPEGFVTALILDIPERGPDRVGLVNLGHPPPYLIHGETVAAVPSAAPSPPLGLGDLALGPPQVDTVDFPPGATLLLYTDGVIEARGPDGTFYPLADRLPAFASLPPDDLLAALHRDLRRHVGSRLTDDAALLAIHHRPHRA